MDTQSFENMIKEQLNITCRITKVYIFIFDYAIIDYIQDI